jgi:hypothetical protein
MNRIPFTLSERTEKKYTIADAIKFAQEYLRERGYAMCMNSVSRLSETQPITLVDLNHITKELVEESMYYSVRL